MKQTMLTSADGAKLSKVLHTAAVIDSRPPLITRFGDAVDVRNRGTLRVGSFVGSHAKAQDAPAVVRIWTDEQCRELTSHQARALAAQLLAAATLADAQNSH